MRLALFIAGGRLGLYHRRSAGPPTGEAREAGAAPAALPPAAACLRAPPSAPTLGPALPSSYRAPSPPPPLVWQGT